MHVAIRNEDPDQLMMLLWQLVPEYLKERQLSEASVDDMIPELRDL